MKHTKQKELVIAIVGPTATGKSAFGIALAKRLGGEIISADSRQVYKGLDIGSGKVTKREMAGVPHHLRDVADPKKSFTVVDYVRRAEEAIADIVLRRKTPIIVGGTGLYIDALLTGAAFPKVDEDKALRKELSKKTTEELFAMLAKLDPRRAKEIDRHNPMRLIRAIEIAQTLGAVPPVKNKKPPYRVLWLGLSMSREHLRKVIAARLSSRIRDGLVEEVRELIARGVTKKRLLALGLEYRYAVMHIDGALSKQEFEETLATKIYQYAMRQLTWFKRNKELIWIEKTLVQSV